MNMLEQAKFKEISKRTSDVKKTSKAFENNKNEVKPVRHITTINEKYKNKEYPGTNVKYKSRTFWLNGEKVEGVFPVFNSIFDTKLFPKSLYFASDEAQKKYCMKMLAKRVESDPDFAKKFTPRQLQQIKDLQTPSGYTWHHHELPGRMQLVKTDEHSTCRHTGGRCLWGGGQDYR